MNRKNTIVVIGAGAAGLMAAAAASEAGAQVTVLEHNEKAGKKIYITGKGRCNFTNACDTQNFFRSVVRNPKFLYSALYDFDQQQMIRFLENNGCPTKVERGNRAFPQSDHASDVTAALVRCCQRNGVKFSYRTEVSRITCVSGRAAGVVTRTGEKIPADAVILASGGISYPSTGSTGDGYRFAEELGLEVVKCSPSLVPLETADGWEESLQGLSLKNVAVSMTPWEKDEGHGGKRRKPLYSGFGEMMFTHFGVTGPLILSASAHCDFDRFPEGFLMALDLKPALDEEQLCRRLEREFSLAPHKELAHAVRPLFPERLASVVAQQYTRALEGGIFGIRPSAQGGTERQAYTFNSAEIRALASLIKAVPMHISSKRGFNEAVVTRGGISVKEVDPSTMECRKVPGFYIAGEVLDVDALTGGYNLQIAWSTGHLAGSSAAKAPAAH